MVDLALNLSQVGTEKPNFSLFLVTKNETIDATWPCVKSCGKPCEPHDHVTGRITHCLLKLWYMPHGRVVDRVTHCL